MVEFTNVEVNAISLVASEDSKITDVSLYSGRAEVTRLFKFDIKAGQNKVTISGLPRALQHNSVRVEGRGNASIHDVVVSKTLPPRNIPTDPTPLTTQAPDPLKRKRDELQRDTETAQQVRTVLNNYLSNINAVEFDGTRLSDTLRTYVSLARTSNREILDLEEQLAVVNERIEEGKRKEKEESNKSHVHFVSSWQVSINVYSELEEEVRIQLKYAVYSAEWAASYDFRVDTQAKDKAATVLYKAIVMQNTGESWENVPLTLETTTPSFGIEIPALSSWRVKPTRRRVDRDDTRRRSRDREYYYGSTSRERVRSSSRSPGRRRRSRRARDSLSPQRLGRNYSPTAARYSPTSPSYSPVLMHQTLDVSNKSDIVATFQVPGLVSVPSDGASHNFTVAQLSLSVDLLWYGIPAVDARAHIKAKIKNDSEYPFIPGPASIYRDGSFVATTDLPSVSPQEIFDCPLGLDPSIRFTYHPREKKSAQSGFYTKTSTQSFTQRITILNTKSTTLKNLKVLDRVPVSEDERIEVKVLNPNLTVPAANAAAAAASSGNGTGLRLTESTSTLAQILKLPIRVSSSIAAQWDGADEPGVDQSAVGKNGKFNWLVSIPPQGSIGLVLQFEVHYPENLAIDGL